MALDAERLEEMYEAREENRLRPVAELVDGIEAQIDEDLKGGWGDIREEFPDPRDPRRVHISLTVELDSGLMDALDGLEPSQQRVVERELQRRYLSAGFHALSLLDQGRIRIEHLARPGSGATDGAAEAEHPRPDGPAGE